MRDDEEIVPSGPQHPENRSPQTEMHAQNNTGVRTIPQMTGPPIDIGSIVEATVRAVLSHETATRDRREAAPNDARFAPTIKNSELAALLPEFSGVADDVSAWLDRVNAVQAVYDVPDDVIQLVAVTKLTGQARQWYYSKVDYVSMPWNVLKEELKIMFASRPGKIELMRKFEGRKWRRNEKFSDYYSDKILLGNRAGVNETDMVEYLIDGFDNPILQGQARMQQFSYVSDLLRVMKNLTNEDRASNVRDTRYPRRPLNSVVPRTGDSAPAETTTSTPIRCYNCNIQGHRAYECRKPRREAGSCYECGSRDHQVRDCPQRRKRASTRAAADSTTSTNVVTGQGRMPYTIDVEVSFYDENNVNCKYDLKALIDTGSPISILKSRYVPQNVLCESVQDEFTGVNGSKLEILGMIKTDVRIENHMIPITFYVVPDQSVNFCVLLGRDFISLPNVNVEFKEKAIVTFCHFENSNRTTNESPNFLNNEIMLIDTIGDNNSFLNCQLDIEPTASTAHVAQLESDLNTHYFLPERPENPETDITMKIRVNPDHNPFYCHPRRLSFSDKAEVEKIVDDLLQRNIICKSQSPYSSPIVLVKKKDKVRMCIDYRALNKITERDNFPLPLIEDHIDSLRGKTCFTRLDLKDAFHHVDVDSESVKYTSFVTPFGQFSYLKMPFGLKNSPSCFMRFVNTAFRELIDAKKLLIYVDDILIATSSVEENLSILREVYDVLVRNKLELRLDKCSFLKPQIDHLGYTINSEGVRPSPKNIEAIVRFPVPTNFKTLHSFIGLASYFRKFIAQFSLIIKPLNDLLKKANHPDTTDFVFDQHHLQAFEKIKSVLVSQPLLRIYSPVLETQLNCDACKYGIGAVLVQRQPEDNVFHPVFYFSKRTTAAEQNYHSFELEALAIVCALERFKIYLQGIKFTIFTDCNSLKMTLDKRDVNPRILRWSLVLHNFDYDVKYRESSRMKHVDALSRCIMILEENTFERNLALMQNRDPKITDIAKTLETRELPSFELRDGLVYKKCSGRLLFYVPDSMISNVIRANHDEVGHVGVTKVVDLIQKNYYFPNMTTLVKNHIDNCLKCIVYSPRSGRQEGLLHPIPKGNVPFDTIHVDHQGPFETTGKKFKYIFEVVDGFSKFVKLFPCKTTNSAEVIKHLRSYFHSYIRPRRVIADRGSNFRSSEFADFLAEQNIQLVLIAKNTPRGNGQIERINRDLTPMFSKLAPATDKWDRVIQDIEFAINNTKNRSTGNYPSVLLFGVRQKGKVCDLLKEYLEEVTDSEPERDLITIRETASRRLINEQERVKAQYDKSHKTPKQYQLGDYVMCSNFDTTPGVNKKHLPKYKGPYEIRKVLPNDRYVIADIPGFQVTQRPYQTVVAASDMKPWISDGSVPN